jgi:hypothetical protein
MSFVLPRPKSVTADEVVLDKTDWERIVAALGERDEDQDDIAAIMAARDDDAQFAARVVAERGPSVETTIPIEVVNAKLDGAHPVKAWREYRDWTQLYLSFKSDVGRDLIAQIETRRKKGSAETLSRLARALAVPIEALIENEAD